MPLGGDFAVTLSQSLGNNAEVAPKNPYLEHIFYSFKIVLIRRIFEVNLNLILGQRSKSEVKVIAYFKILVLSLSSFPFVQSGSHFNSFH